MTDNHFIPDQVQQQKAQADHAVSLLSTFAWPTLTLLLGNAVSTLVSPAVQDADSVASLFFATLAWSLGVAGAVAAVQLGLRVPGPTALLLAGGWLAVCSVIATSLAVGALDNPMPCGPSMICPNARATAFAYLGEAVNTFGPLGVILGAASGALVASWAVDTAKKNGLVT